jgi:hypothetical protein
MFNNPIFSYVGFVLGVVAMAFGVLKPEWADYAWTAAGILGFGSVSLLRAKIDSEGWKTHAIFVVVGVGALLQIFGVIAPEHYQALMVVFAPLTGVTMQQALVKSTASVPKISGP